MRWWADRPPDAEKTGCPKRDPRRIETQGCRSSATGRHCRRGRHTRTAAKSKGLMPCRQAGCPPSSSGFERCWWWVKMPRGGQKQGFVVQLVTLRRITVTSRAERIAQCMRQMEPVQMTREQYRAAREPSDTWRRKRTWPQWQPASWHRVSGSISVRSPPCPPLSSPCPCRCGRSAWRWSWRRSGARPSSFGVRE